MASNIPNNVLSDLIDDDTDSRRGFFNWWYSLAALPEVERSAPLKERERVRRSRFTATILFGILGILLATFFATLVLHDLLTSTIIAGAFLSAILCTFFNRKGYMTIAGLILFLQADGGQAFAFIHTAGGLDLSRMMLLDQLFIIGEMISVSFFSPLIMFLCVLFNCIVLDLILGFAPSTPALYAVAHSAAGLQYYVEPFLIQGIIVIVSFLWTRSMNNAIERADRAQVIAALEHQIANQIQSISDEKAQLEQNVLYIQDILVRVAKGDLNVQMPITQDSVLWPLAVSFKTLLVRYRQLHQAALAYQQLESEVQMFALFLRNAKHNFMPIRLGSRGTILDQIYVECDNNILGRYDDPRWRSNVMNPRGSGVNQNMSGIPQVPNNFPHPPLPDNANNTGKEEK